METALLIALIFINGIFAMTEIALVTARRARLQSMADAGDRKAEAAIELGDDPTRFLSTIQIGLTSIGILNGVVGEAVFARPLATWMHDDMGIAPDTAGYAATAITVVIITYFTIVIGELVPKRIGQMRPEAIARYVARPMNVLGIVTRPFVKLLTFSTDVLLRIFRLPGTRQTVTEEEIHSLLEEGSETGVIDRQEHAMARNVFLLDDRAVVSLMIPRLDVVYLDVNEPLEENLRRVQESEFSRFPVCAGGWEDVLGIASTKMLLGQTLRGRALDLRANLQPAVFVPETINANELLESFRTSNVHSALVVDEYGDVQGFVTLQDVLEAITGEFHTANREDSWAVRREDGSWLLDGMLAVPELKDTLQLRSVIEEERGRYHTLAGMLMHLLGRVPVETDHVEWEKWRFEIVDMDGQRIDKVIATPVPVLEVAEE